LFNNVSAIGLRKDPCVGWRRLRASTVGTRTEN